MPIKREQLLIFDGACGSNLDAIVEQRPCEPALQPCNEFLNICAPQAVTALHLSFLEAGSNVIETNTFGANRVVLAEYGLESRVREINAAAVACAKEAIAGRTDRYIAGSVGPGTKLPSLGHIPPSELKETYLEQCDALVNAGVDALIIETCQDPLQVKMALMAAFDAAGEGPDGIPVLLSVTMETTGTMLLGTSVDAVVAAARPFPLFSLGFNCATGPAHMKQHLLHLSRTWDRRISAIPNAGMPQVKDGETHYDLTADQFADALHEFVNELGVSVVGGCCGTTTEHIRCLADKLGDLAPRERETNGRGGLTSLFSAVEIPQDIPPIMIGERMNTHGSKRFKRKLLDDDFEGAAKMGAAQEKKGAHLLDLCVAYAGRDEAADAARMVALLRQTTKAPLVIDSTRPAVIEAALMEAPGRCLINSINLEDGGKTADQVLRLAKHHGAAVIALTIGPNGMAMTAEEKLATAKEIFDMAVREHGLAPEDIFFDPLTFTLGSGDETLVTSALETLAGITLIKKELPGVHASLGVSNVSFGLPKDARPFLNSVFLHRAIGAGLDAAIVDAGKILPMSEISKEDRQACDALIEGASNDPLRSALEEFLDHFSKREKTTDDRVKGELPPEEKLRALIMKGEDDGLEDVLDILLERYPPLNILNEILIPAMKKVGVLFGRGDMLLPFVLQSAQVMKAAVTHLEPLMDKRESKAGPKILLATVAGDVHDIGKNLVDIILSNNGYTIENIGINVPADSIIEKAKEVGADAIGLSGLLVKSALHMLETLPRYQEAGLDVPILLGGRPHAQIRSEECAAAYHGPVVYCADAFAGLAALKEMEAGTLSSTEYVESSGKALQAETVRAKVRKDNPAPSPPFKGSRHVEDIQAKDLFSLVNRRALYRGRWGFRKGKRSKEELHTVIEKEAAPAFDRLLAECIEDQLATPKVAYGYFDCAADGERLLVQANGKELSFDFPRQEFSPGLCLADYFKSEKDGGDVVGFFVATVGNGLLERAAQHLENDKYKDYLLTHGFAMELAEALAEYWHRRMKIELRTGEPTSGLDPLAKMVGGLRFGFGYSSCPDLDSQRTLFDLLKPEDLGISLTENMEMIPESTTSAIIVHHPDATYFAV